MLPNAPALPKAEDEPKAEVEPKAGAVGVFEPEAADEPKPDEDPKPEVLPKAGAAVFASPSPACWGVEGEPKLKEVEGEPVPPNAVGGFDAKAPKPPEELGVEVEPKVDG